MTAAEQIAEALHRNLWGLSAVVPRLDPAEILTWDLAIRGEILAAQLAAGDDKLAAEVTLSLVSAGVIPDNPDLEWWTTPLGRLVAQSVGHPSAEAVSQTVAAAMLGVSQPRVHQMVQAGKLDRHPDGGVTTASVRARASSR